MDTLARLLASLLGWRGQLRGALAAELPDQLGEVLADHERRLARLEAMLAHPGLAPVHIGWPAGCPPHAAPV